MMGAELFLSLLLTLPLAVKSLAPYAACPYSDSATYGSLYNTIGLQGPLSGISYVGSALTPTSAGFCECVSGYSDYASTGTCSPLFNSTYPLATVDPLIESGATQLLYTSATPQLLGNVFSFQLQSPFVAGRNISWSLSAIAPTYVPSSTTTGNSWTLSGANDVRCRRPGMYDVSGLDAQNRGYDLLISAMDWNNINSGVSGGLSICGWSSVISGNTYINKALLTVQYADPVPNSGGLVRQSAATYPLQVTSPRTVTVASNAVTVNAAIVLSAAVIQSVYSPGNNTITLVIQTSVQYPWQLGVVGNSLIPSTFSFTGTPTWTLNDIGMCPQSTANSTCTQQFILVATPTASTVCPASSPQQGTLNGIYGVTLNVTARGNTNSSSPNASVNTTVTTDSICKSVQLGVTTTVGLTSYADSAFSVAPSSTGYIQGSKTYWQIVAQSAQVSVNSIRINQIWYSQGNSFAMSGLANTNVNYTTGSSNIAYPSTGTSYPTVRMLWDLQDASNCQNGASNYPLQPNSPSASGVPLASCNPFTTGGAGVVQPGWLNAPSSTPETLYPTGYTLLASNNQFAVTHQQASGGQFSGGVSKATASFSYTNSVKFTSAAMANQGPATQSLAAPDYSSCNPASPSTDPCQKYMFFQPANTYSPYSFASSITIFYGGMNTSTQSVKKRDVIITSDGKILGNDDNLFVFKNTRSKDPFPPVNKHALHKRQSSTSSSTTSDQANNPALLSGQVIILTSNSTDTSIFIGLNQQVQLVRGMMTNPDGTLTFAGVVMVILFLVAILCIITVMVYYCIRIRRQRSYSQVGVTRP